MAAHGLGVVLDAYRGGFRGPQSVDAQQVGQGAVVDGDGLGDLEEADQLKAVQAVGAGLVVVHLGQPGVDGGVGRGQPVDVGEPEEPTEPFIIVFVEDATRTDARTAHYQRATGGGVTHYWERWRR
jgi:hypothetical protein